MTFAATLAAQEPDVVALADSRAALRWSEVDRMLRGVATGLLNADLGTARRVAVFAENSIEAALTYVGGLLGDVSVVPANSHLTADELAYLLSDSEAGAVFVGPETSERGLDAARAAGVRLVVGWRCPATTGVVPWEAWTSRSVDDPPTALAPRPPLLYTSGTTGRPKGAELPPTSFPRERSVDRFVERQSESRFVGFGPHLVVGPMYHTGPLAGVRLLCGAVPLVILDRFDAEATLAAIERHQVGSTIMVPTHFVRLLSLPEAVRRRYDVSSLRRVLHTGAACPPDVKRAMLAWWGPVLYEHYGATEVGTTCSIGPHEWLEHPGSVGQPVEPFRAVVVGDDGRPVPTGTVGRLYFEDSSGRGIVYHGDPEKTRAAHLRPGVFTLGEMAYVNPDGYVYIADRFSDMVVSGGVNLYPAEAEQVLIQHPDVADVACIGVPHPEMGEELKALVVVRDPGAPPPPGDLLNWCRDRLSHHKCPRSVDFVDTVGRNPLGKVNKRALRAPYWAMVDGTVPSQRRA